jgi:hypothetical protein
MEQQSLRQLQKDLLRLPKGMKQTILDKLMPHLAMTILGDANFPIDSGALHASGKFTHNGVEGKIHFDVPVKSIHYNTSYAEAVETRWGRQGSSKFPAEHYLYVTRHMNPLVINPGIDEGMRVQWKK